ncbi:unnamed protein product [Parajaminaea phylloscopi]
MSNRHTNAFEPATNGHTSHHRTLSSPRSIAGTPGDHGLPPAGIDPGSGNEPELDGIDPRKLTPSCSRCRAKKLKCDTQQPCSNCIAKGLESECRKDQRVPRGRKRPRPDKVTAQEEMAHLRKRLQELEDQFPDGPSPPDSADDTREGSVPATTAFFESKSKRASVSSRTEGAPAQDVAASLKGWIGPYEVAGSSTNIDWPGTTRIVESYRKKLGTLDLDHGHEAWMLDVVHPHWADPVNFQGRVELSRQARTMLPSTIIIEELIDTFFYRCNHLLGNIILEPRFRRLAAVSYKSNLTTEEILTSPLYIDPCCWIMLFQILSIALCFYPYETSHPTPAFHAVNAFRATEGQMWTDRWHDHSRRCLVVGECLQLTSLPAIQSALLMCFRARESDAWIRGLQTVIIHSAQRMGCHQLGNHPLPENLRVEDRARKEIITRLWAHLTARDGFRLASDRVNVIQPSQSTTCLPLQISDLEILAGKRHSRSSAEFTELSYSLALVSLSRIAREIGEAQLRLGSGRHLSLEAKDKYTHSLVRWAESLPEFYRPSATTHKPAGAFIQRWRLLTQAFHQVLRLHQGDLSRRSVRHAALPLAKALVGMYPMVINMCPVSRASWTNWMHLMSACVIIAFDLLEGEARPRDSASRSVASKRPEALALLASGRDSLVPLSEVAMLVVHCLMQREEHRAPIPTCRDEDSNAISLDFHSLYCEVVAEAYSSCKGPQVGPLSLSVPAKGHDAVMPALYTATHGGRRCDILPAEPWDRLAAMTVEVQQGDHFSSDAVDSNSDADADLFTQVAAANRVPLSRYAPTTSQTFTDATNDADRDLRNGKATQLNSASLPAGARMPGPGQLPMTPSAMGPADHAFDGRTTGSLPTLTRQHSMGNDIGTAAMASMSVDTNQASSPHIPSPVSSSHHHPEQRMWNDGVDYHGGIRTPLSVHPMHPPLHPPHSGPYGANGGIAPPVHGHPSHPAYRHDGGHGLTGPMHPMPFNSYPGPLPPAPL